MAKGRKGMANGIEGSRGWNDKGKVKGGEGLREGLGDGSKEGPRVRNGKRMERGGSREGNG